MYSVFSGENLYAVYQGFLVQEFVCCLFFRSGQGRALRLFTGSLQRFWRIFAAFVGYSDVLDHLWVGHSAQLSFSFTLSYISFFFSLLPPLLLSSFMFFVQKVKIQYTLRCPSEEVACSGVWSLYWHSIEINEWVDVLQWDWREKKRVNETSGWREQTSEMKIAFLFYDKSKYFWIKSKTEAEQINFFFYPLVLGAYFI